MPYVSLVRQTMVARAVNEIEFSTIDCNKILSIVITYSARRIRVKKYAIIIHSNYKE